MAQQMPLDLYFKVYFMSLFTLMKSLCTLVEPHLLREWGPQPLLAHTVQTAAQTFKIPSPAGDRPLQAPDSSGVL